MTPEVTIGLVMGAFPLFIIVLMIYAKLYHKIPPDVALVVQVHVGLAQLPGLERAKAQPGLQSRVLFHFQDEIEIVAIRGLALVQFEQEASLEAVPAAGLLGDSHPELHRGIGEGGDAQLLCFQAHGPGHPFQG